VCGWSELEMMVSIENAAALPSRRPESSVRVFLKVGERVTCVEAA